MPLKRISRLLEDKIKNLKNQGLAKSDERIVKEVIKPKGEKGPRFILEGQGEKEFIRMNSNSYMGMSFLEEIIAVEEDYAEDYGVGPGAVRFISGTYDVHRNLEECLAKFHNREAGMIFSSAYMTVLGVLTSLISKETCVISDELNHNCIINGIRLSRPLEKKIYKNLDMDDLENCLQNVTDQAKRVLIVSDGIFSMRGSYAPLDQIMDLAQKYDEKFSEGVLVVIDDSHGVGAFGSRGRGTEDYTQSAPVDVLIGTLGKAYGANGGYVVTNEIVATFLREKAITYIYSNPITAAEAGVALKVVNFLDTSKGKERLQKLSGLTRQFENGLKELGLETIESPHPIVPLMVRDTEKTSTLVAHLFQQGVLATGLNYPVVPKGDQSIRFQINADHTSADIDYVLKVLEKGL